MAAQPDDSVSKFQEMKADRFRVLNYVYHAAEGSPLAYIQGNVITRDLDMDTARLEHIIVYLLNEKLISVTLGATNISITHWGIRAVEAALDTPEKPTHYFPPVNVINFHGAASNTQIQQGTVHSSQTNEIHSGDLNAIRAFTSELRGQLERLELPRDQLGELNADLEALHIHLESPRPKRPVISALLMSARSVIENAGGSFAADILKNMDALPV